MDPSKARQGLHGDDYRLGRSQFGSENLDNILTSLRSNIDKAGRQSIGTKHLSKSLENLLSAFPDLQTTEINVDDEDDDPSYRKMKDDKLPEFDADNNSLDNIPVKESRVPSKDVNYRYMMENEDTYDTTESMMNSNDLENRGGRGYYGHSEPPPLKSPSVQEGKPATAWTIHLDGGFQSPGFIGSGDQSQSVGQSRTRKGWGTDGDQKSRSSIVPGWATQGVETNLDDSTEACSQRDAPHSVTSSQDVWLGSGRLSTAPSLETIVEETKGDVRGKRKTLADSYGGKADTLPKNFGRKETKKPGSTSKVTKTTTKPEARRDSTGVPRYGVAGKKVQAAPSGRGAHGTSPVSGRSTTPIPAMKTPRSTDTGSAGMYRLGTGKPRDASKHITWQDLSDKDQRIPRQSGMTSSKSTGNISDYTLPPGDEETFFEVRSRPVVPPRKVFTPSTKSIGTKSVRQPSPGGISPSQPTRQPPTINTQRPSPPPIPPKPTIPRSPAVKAQTMDYNTRNRAASPAKLRDNLLSPSCGDDYSSMSLPRSKSEDRLLASAKLRSPSPTKQLRELKQGIAAKKSQLAIERKLHGGKWGPSGPSNTSQSGGGGLDSAGEKRDKPAAGRRPLTLNTGLAQSYQQQRFTLRGSKENLLQDCTGSSNELDNIDLYPKDYRTLSPPRSRTPNPRSYARSPLTVNPLTPFSASSSRGTGGGGGGGGGLMSDRFRKLSAGDLLDLDDEDCDPPYSPPIPKLSSMSRSRSEDALESLQRGRHNAPPPLSRGASEDEETLAKRKPPGKVDFVFYV